MWLPVAPPFQGVQGGSDAVSQAEVNNGFQCTEGLQAQQHLPSLLLMAAPSSLAFLRASSGCHSRRPLRPSRDASRLLVQNARQVHVPAQDKGGAPRAELVIVG